MSQKPCKPLFLLIGLLLVNIATLFAQKTEQDQSPQIGETFSSSFNRLVWSDEFDYVGAADEDKWFHQTIIPNGESWFNGEIQHYTDRLENTFISNGVMRITAQRETFTDQGVTKDYTSARINSKFAFQYGRVEIRAKLPTGIGTWPALWMLGKNISERGAYWEQQGFGSTGWPACGEIDIMEHWGHNQDYIQSATHTPSSFGATVNHGGQFIPNVSNSFHAYSLEWTEDRLVFAVDDVIHYVYDPSVKNADTWPFDAEQYLIFNIAIQPSIFPSFTKSTMEIDYVRVYQEGGTVSLDEVELEQVSALYPNPFDDHIIIDLPQSASDNIEFFITSMDGKFVKSLIRTPSQNQVYIDGLGNLEAGAYVINFYVNGMLNTLKAVKQ